MVKYRVLTITQPLEISYNACQSSGRELFVSGNRRPDETATVNDYARIFKG